MNDYTWSDVYDQVRAKFARTTGLPDAKILRQWGYQAVLAIIRESGALYRSWDNGVAGDLEVIGGTVVLPNTFTQEISVLWDGEPLRYRSLEAIERDDPSWRTTTGTPAVYTKRGNYMLLDAVPIGSVTGMLQVWGMGYPSPFSDTEGADNPLSYLPIEWQLLPADYIVSRLPAKKQPLTDNGRIIGMDDSELIVKQDALDNWLAGKEQAIFEIRSREGRPHDGS
ncbi:MAG: phage adaptor protein [Armatimonadota bacterium]